MDLRTCVQYPGGESVSRELQKDKVSYYMLMSCKIYRKQKMCLFCHWRHRDDHSWAISPFPIVSFVDVMVLNDIIEQAAGRQSKTPEQGGNILRFIPPPSSLFSHLAVSKVFFFCRCLFFFSFFFSFDSVPPYRSCVYYLVYRVMSILSCSMYIIVETSDITASPCVIVGIPRWTFLSCAPLYIVI